jgi:hypothetical protein
MAKAKVPKEKKSQRKEEKTDEEKKIELNKSFLKHDPLYTDKSSVEEMDTNNKLFLENTTHAAFTTALKKEQKVVDKLVEASYYPVAEGKKTTDAELIKDCLNIV